MRLTKRHLMYVNWIRGQPLDSLVEPNSMEIKELERWDREMKQTVPWPKYGPSEVAQYLSFASRYQFPFPLSGTFTGDKGVQAIQAWYRLRGFKIDPPVTPWTPEQLELIEVPSGSYVVNAGPGTGKTTTAIERAYRHRHEGVLIVSYSNATIQEIKNRFKIYPETRGLIGYKEFNKKISITTADALASHITGCMNGSYDHNIQVAIAMVGMMGKTLPYRHVIIDESQDLDDQRGLLLMLLYSCGICSKSIMIFGDPRQQINDRAGQWYRDLWTSGVKEGKNYQQKSLSRSHRFATQSLLNLHNDLSSHRPNLHVALTGPDLPIGTKMQGYNTFGTEEGLILFVSHFKEHYLVGQGIPLSEVVIVTPSIEADNQTSKSSQRLCAILKSFQIPCYTRAEGNFQPNAVLMSTIHGVKGREFKIVILFAMSGYPGKFPIPFDTANSLIYVAHTRAKSEIIYLYNDILTLPRNVSTNHVEHQLLQNVKTIPSPPDIRSRSLSVTQICQDHGWSKLVETNRYVASAGTVIPGNPKLFKFIEDPRLMGILADLVIKTLLIGRHVDIFQRLKENKYQWVTEREYLDYIRNGMATQGQSQTHVLLIRDRVNSISREELTAFQDIMAREIQELTWEDWIMLTQISDLIQSGSANARFDFRDTRKPTGVFPLESFMTVALWIQEKYGNHAIADHQVRCGRGIGVLDVVTESTLIELKCVQKVENEHRWQSLIYNCWLDRPRDTVIVYNLLDGQIEEVKSPQHWTLWRWLSDAFIRLKNQTDMCIQRQNHLSIHPDVPKNVYTVDTEFGGCGIFDFAMINLDNPFASIIQPIKSRDPFAPLWVVDHNPVWSMENAKILFQEARNNIDDLFEDIFGSKCLYYMGKEDRIIPEQHGLECVDVGEKIHRLGEKIGVFLSSNKTAKLGRLYDILVEPIDLHGDVILEHTAVSDALILYDLVHLGHIYDF